MVSKKEVVEVSAKNLLAVDPAADDQDEHTDPEDQKDDRELEVHVVGHGLSLFQCRVGAELLAASRKRVCCSAPTAL